MTQNNIPNEVVNAFNQYEAYDKAHNKIEESWFDNILPNSTFFKSDCGKYTLSTLNNMFLKPVIVAPNVLLCTIEDLNQ
jgi:hypothetical protein